MYKVMRAGNEIAIRNHTYMQKYFDYTEIRTILHGNDPKWKPQDVIGIFESANCNRILSVIQNASDLFHCDTFSSLFTFNEKSTSISTPDRRFVDFDALETFLKELWSEADTVTEVVQTYLPVCNVMLTNLEAYELLLFCSLFTCMQLTPNADDLELLKKHMDESVPKTAVYHLKDPKKISVFTPTAQLPCFEGVSEEEQVHLGLTVIYNELNEPITVTLESSPLRRHLAAHEEILVLTANGKAVNFLPRFCAAQGYIYRQEQSNLLATDKVGHTFSLSLNTEGPIFFSESKKHGILAADKDGRFLSVPFDGKKPDNSVCWLKGDLQDYGFLTSQGTYEGAYTRECWKGILFFDLGGGNGIAVTSNRCAIDSTGTVVGENVAAISCCENRFILLHMDGSVTTDRGDLQLPNLYAHAVCVNRDGYWVVTDDTLFHIGKIVTKYERIPDELERNNLSSTVYGLYADGEISPL